MNKTPVNDSFPVISELGQQATLYGLVGVVAGIAFPLVASLLKISELRLPFDGSSLFAVQAADPVLWITDTAPFFLGLVAALAGRRQDLALEANRALVARDAELKAIRENLELAVEARTRELDERNAQTRDVIAFGRQLADAQDLTTLESIAVESIAEQFSYLEVNLFELEQNGQSASLKASSSDAGKRLTTDGFRVAVSDQTVVGRVARRGKPVTSSVNPENLHKAGRPGTAPLSMAQTTVPLVVRGKVVGVLDVHSQMARSVGQNETEILQLLADQLAASMENLRLVTEMRAAVAQLESTTAQSTRASWQRYVIDNRPQNQSASARFGSEDSADPGSAAENRTFALLLRGQAIGSIKLRRKAGVNWAQADLDLIEKVAGQISLAIENARLLEETQQRATQEQIVSEISARFSRSLDVDALLQTAVREFAALPDVAEATVVLKQSNGSALNEES
jgi:GAF domain-containing protein